MPGGIVVPEGPMGRLTLEISAGINETHMLPIQPTTPKHLITSQETTTCLARGLRLQHLGRVALFVLILSQLLTGPARGAEDAADPYDALHDVLMTRYGPDGKSYGENETGPVILPFSIFPFGDNTYEKFKAALDASAALPQEQIEAYSDIKRALLQRHLWKVFDATIPHIWRGHNDRRAAVQPKIASLIQRLALTGAQIRAIPNTLAATVKFGRFAQRHDPKDPFKPFLAADLYSKESSWICLGEVTNPIPAVTHSRKLKWRSAFLQFIRLPGGRTKTLKYLEKLKNRTEPFPVRTQFALIEQAFLISDDGELVLSPLIVSISLRAFLDVNRNFFDLDTWRKATQCVAEFVMQPRQLMQAMRS
jgi:hypothetical protein